MTSLFAAAVLPLTRGVRLGPMRLTVYGACAAAGVSLAVPLGARLAPRAGADPEAAWDVGLFAILSCFLTSRLLLVLGDPGAFARYPLPVLGLPSLTIGGIALAGGMLAIYMWQKRLPLRPMLDAFAVPGALLAAFLELGHALDGSEPGMPWKRDPFGNVRALYPVSFWGLVVSAALALVLWLALHRTLRMGRVGALGLIFGGFFAFALNILSLPADLFNTWWLEPGQLVALGAMTAGALLWTFSQGSRAPIPPSARGRTAEVPRAHEVS